ncbi:MAG: thioredoxin domain-containing protein [Alphaproteobacteria bacterium]
MLRKLLYTIALIGLGFLTSAGTRDAAATMAPLAEALSEKSLGSKDAPVTIYAFESLSCPHCAQFHTTTFPELKKLYIDTGKVRYVLIDYPHEPRALFATMVARCTGNERYFGTIDLLFREQRTWAGAQDFAATLKNLARFAGLTDDEFEQCVKNKELFEGIRAQQDAAEKKFNVKGVPLFVIGDKRVDGVQPLSTFEEIIKPMLK